MMRRDRSATAPHVEALLDIAREHSIPLWIAFGTFQEGWVRAGVADRDAGIAKMREGITLLRSQLLGTFMPLLMTLLAETEAEAGRPEAALAIVDEQLAIAEQTGQRWYLAELHRARGEILLKRRPCDEAAAESAFARAIDIAQTQSAKLFELQAAVSLGRLWLAQGRSAHPRELVAPVCAWLNTGPDCNALSEARVLMRNLTAM
jgi:predicted ATPase